MVSNLAYFQYTFGMGLESFPKPDNSTEKPKIEILPKREKTQEEIKKRENVLAMLGEKSDTGKLQSERFFAETQTYGKFVSEAKLLKIDLPVKSDIVSKFQQGLKAKRSNTELVHAMIGSTPGANVERVQGASIDVGRELRTYIREKLSTLSPEKKEKLKNIPGASLYL
jgi:hypothetical protein